METTNSKGKKTIIVAKWVLGLLLMFGGIGFFSVSILSGIFVIISALLIIPPVSDKLKERVVLWSSKRYVRIIIPIVFIFAGAITLGSVKMPDNSELTTTENQKEEKLSHYQSYINKCEKLIENLSDKMREAREGNLTATKQNEVYKKLVDEAVVSAEYIPLIAAISEGIVFSNEEYGFSLTSETRNRIQSLGNDELAFVEIAGCIGMPIQGGFSKDFIEVFERYRNKYGYYGEKRKLVGIDGDVKENIEYDYDFSALFEVLDPQNKEVLNAVYEARKKGISFWYDVDNSFYPYLTSKEKYIDYIKKVYPKSPYIPKWEMKLSANELYAAYDENEVNADNLYKAKIIAVTGIIDNIGKDILDKPYVTLKTGKYLQGVNCYFPNDKNNMIANLSKGQKITVVGKCDGLSLLNVIMQKCEIEE